MNVLMSTTRLAFVAIIVASSISIGAQTAASAPKPNSIAISLKMKEQQVPVGQSPWAILSVKNLTDESMEIHSYTYRVYVEGEKGEPPTTLVQRQATGRLKPGDVRLREDENALWSIAPDRSDDLNFQLAYLYDLSEPGEYTVYAEVMDPHSQKLLRTNTVQFKVQAPAQPSPSHLTIVVEDAAGAPIPGASVQVQHWAGRAQLIQDGVANTGAQGRVSFKLDPTITYHVFASAQAFLPGAASVGNYGDTGHVFKLAVMTGGGVRVESLPK